MDLTCGIARRMYSRIIVGDFRGLSRMWMHDCTAQFSPEQSFATQNKASCKPLMRRLQKADPQNLTAAQQLESEG